MMRQFISAETPANMMIIWSSFALYIRNLKFTEPSGNFTFSYVFNDLELHRFINLFSVTNCE